MKKWKEFSKWFYPGMKVKRWGLVGIFFALLVGFSLILLIGKPRISAVYNFLSYDPASYYLLASLAFIVGAGGLVWGINRLAASVTDPIDSFKQPTSHIIWKNRLLAKGPRVVAIGGGTGLSVLLRGLKRHTMNLTAIVTVTDDGGSSGRLRREMDMLPPGDIRNCIIALADDETRMSKILQHRFSDGSELEGHSLGNLIIAGLEQIEGSFDRAIEETSILLNIRGRVIPSTLANTGLVAHFEGGKVVEGESTLSNQPERIEKIELSKKARAYPPAIEEISSADIIILGPGSLFTSLIPNLLVEEVAETIEAANGKKYYVTNLMTEPGETDEFSARDHLNTLNSYLDVGSLDYAVLNSGNVNRDLLHRYSREGAELVEPDLTEENEFGVKPLQADLVDTVELEGKETVKHDYCKLAELIMSSWD